MVNEKTRAIIRKFKETWAKSNAKQYFASSKDQLLIDEFFKNDELDEVIKKIELFFKSFSNANITTFIEYYDQIENFNYEIESNYFENIKTHKIDRKYQCSHFNEIKFEDIISDNKIFNKFEKELVCLRDWCQYLTHSTPDISDDAGSILHHPYPLVVISKFSLIQYFIKILKQLCKDKMNERWDSHFSGTEFDDACFKLKGDAYEALRFKAQHSSAFILEDVKNIGPKAKEILRFRFDRNRVCVIATENLEYLNDNFIQEKMKESLIV